MTKMYGKIDCYSQEIANISSDVHRSTHDIYIGLFKFLEYLQAQGETELITYNSGSGASGNGKDYWDTANAAGSNAFSVWKMKANAERGWDWYLYIHTNYTSTNYQATPNSTPTRIMGNTNLISSLNFYSYVMAQAAFSISGSSSVNPWNGTINLSGAAFKSSPVWSSGSTNHEVFVFPRINNITGSAATTKDVCANLKSNAENNGIYNYRQWYSFLYDGNGLLFFCDTSRGNEPAQRRATNIAYFGPYTMLDGISGSFSGKVLGGTGSLGFCMLTGHYAWASETNGAYDTNRTATLPEYTDIGPIVSDQNSFQGGAFCVSDYGVRTFRLGNDNTFITTTYYPNSFMENTITTDIGYDEKTYTLYANESGHYYMMGILDTPLIRCVVGDVYTYDTTRNKKRMVLALRRDINSGRRITIPWDGVTKPLSTKSRDGITFYNPSYNW